MTSLAHAPRVVGTTSPHGLQALADATVEQRRVDLIEARFDLLDLDEGAALRDSTGPVEPHLLQPDWQPYLASCARLEQTGTPVLGTIRLIGDGGRWREDAERLSLFKAVLPVVSWVDIELESALARQILDLARQRGRRVIISHHDFTGTPPADRLDALVARARGLGGDIIKLATTVHTIDDHHRLIDLLHRHRASTETGAPLAVVGMGSLGTPLRSYLPCIGSRLTYGFIDRSAAPGQIPAAELVQRLMADCPVYAAWRGERNRL